jgi:osmotically-inducible protein OsmY
MPDRYDEERERRDFTRQSEDRGFFERAGDEVRRWFGDAEARQRRSRDERYGYGRSPYPDPSAYDREGYGYGRAYGYGSEGWYGQERDWDRPARWRGAGERTWGSPGSQRGGGPREGERTFPHQYWREPERYEPERQPDWEHLHWTGRFGEMRGRDTGPSHAGRGPRGYQRSDDRILDDVCERLARHPWIDASDVEVAVQGGEVTLRGSVDSRSAKRLLEDVAESVWGVREVHNQVRVGAPGPDEFQRGGRAA